MEEKNTSGKPGSSRKTSAKKSTPNTRTIPSRHLNTTMSSSSKIATTPPGLYNSFRHNLTTTFSANATVGRSTFTNPRVMSAANVVPSTDWELECDLAYNEYLQALVKRQLVQKKIVQMKTSMNDQLSIQSEMLFRDKTEVADVQQNMQVNELHIEVNEVIKKLDKSLDMFLQISTESNLEKHLDNIIDVLDVVKNRIGLENIEPLQNQEECDQLSAAIAKCNETLLRIKETTNNYEKVGKLAFCLSETLELKKQIVEKLTELEDKEKGLGYNVLKRISNYFVRLEE